jgi:hypothetical protein
MNMANLPSLAWTCWLEHPYYDHCDIIMPGMSMGTLRPQDKHGVSDLPKHEHSESTISWWAEYNPSNSGHILKQICVNVAYFYNCHKNCRYQNHKLWTDFNQTHSILYLQFQRINHSIYVSLFIHIFSNVAWKHAVCTYSTVCTSPCCVRRATFLIICQRIDMQ